MQYFYVTLLFEVIKISCRALTRKTSNTFTKVSINVIYTCSVMQTRIRKAFVHIYFALFSYRNVEMRKDKNSMIKHHVMVFCVTV